jgi:hypothetical protein
MTAPHGNDFEQRNLEDRLTELFQQRAATVTRARPVDFGSEPGSIREAPAGPKRVRLGTHRQNLGVLAAAAAVFVATAATVLGIQANRHQPAPPLGTGSHPVSTPTASPTSIPTSSARAKSCVAAMPASWRQAITAGAVPVDRALNSVVSANGGTGDYLVVQGNEPPPQTSTIYSDVELALFHGAIGRTIYTPTVSTDIPVADPTGAITADWVAFAVTRPQNLGYTYKVMLYDRSSGTITTLAEWTEQESLRNRVFLGSPVIAAGKVYWLSGTFNKPTATTLDSWDLAQRSIATSVPAANATALIPYGSGMLISYGGGHPDGALFVPTALGNGAGRPLTRAQVAAAAHGSNFGYDGAGTLSWWRHDGGSIGYSSIQVGAAGVRNDDTIHQYAGIGVALLPFTQLDVNESQNGLVDLRTRTLVALPEGVTLQAVVGTTVIFGTGTTKAGAAGLSAVPVSALPAVHC